MKHFAVFGHPISHSKSPFIHQMFAQQCGIQLSYEAIDAPADKFHGQLASFFASGAMGANVTMPLKELAFEYADYHSARASAAGAVNTLIKDGDKICGDNTDGPGLVHDLKRLNIPLAGQRVLLLGAGGAAKGVILPLLNEQPERLHVANRTATKAEHLTELFEDARLSASGLDNIRDQFDVIVNASSASLGGQVPEISPALINGCACYDMMYGADQTTFNRWAARHGAASVYDGLGMLVAQAAISFECWHGIMPETESVVNRLRMQLASN